MNIREIEVSKIDATERLREVDMDWAQAIAASMRENEQLTPIEVYETEPGRYRLIAGGHRLAAVQINIEHYDHRDTILANVVTVADEDDALLREIDENLFRAELTPLDRATFLAERKRIYLKLHPEAKRGGDRRRSKRHGGALIAHSFADATAERLGLSPRVIERAIQLFDKLHPDARKRLAGTVFCSNQKELLELAHYPHARQLEILDLLVGGNQRFGSVKQAIRNLDGDAAEDARSPDERHYESFASLWARCSDATQGRIADFIKLNAKRKRAA